MPRADMLQVQLELEFEMNGLGFTWRVIGT